MGCGAGVHAVVSWIHEFQHEFDHFAVAVGFDGSLAEVRHNVEAGAIVAPEPKKRRDRSGWSADVPEAVVLCGVRDRA